MHGNFNSRIAKRSSYLTCANISNVYPSAERIFKAIESSFFHEFCSFFRAFIKAGAEDPESAKTLADVSQTENDAVISKLERPGLYRNIVTVINPDGTEADPNAKINITEETKFYISEEKHTQIRDQWGENNENLIVLIGGILGMAILGVLLTVIIISGI